MWKSKYSELLLLHYLLKLPFLFSEMCFHVEQCVTHAMHKRTHTQTHIIMFAILDLTLSGLNMGHNTTEQLSFHYKQIEYAVHSVKFGNRKPVHQPANIFQTPRRDCVCVCCFPLYFSGMHKQAYTGSHGVMILPGSDCECKCICAKLHTVRGSQVCVRAGTCVFTRTAAAWWRHSGVGQDGLSVPKRGNEDKWTERS